MFLIIAGTAPLFLSHEILCSGLNNRHKANFSEVVDENL